MILIVENDLGFARVLLDVAREHGLKGIIAPTGSTALAIAREQRPDAITPDINLPDIDGWRVLRRLKVDPETRHIPVQTIATEEDRVRGRRLGAIDVLSKPIQTKSVLDDTLRNVMRLVLRERAALLVADADAARRPSSSARRNWR